MADDRPPEGPRGEAVRVLVVPRHGTVTVCFAGPIVGLLTHWHNGHSWGCRGPDRCNPTAHRARTIWKGYAPVRCWESPRALWVAYTLEVTAVLDEQLRGRELPGEVWELAREAGKRKQAPCRGSFVGVRDEAALLAAFDIRPSLFRMYDTTDLDLGIANPLPPKTLVAAVAVAGPPSAAPPDKPTAPPPRPEQYAELRRFASTLGGKQHEGNGKG